MGNPTYTLRYFNQEEEQYSYKGFDYIADILSFIHANKIDKYGIYKLQT